MQLTGCIVNSGCIVKFFLLRPKHGVMTIYYVELHSLFGFLYYFMMSETH